MPIRAGTGRRAARGRALVVVAGLALASSTGCAAGGGWRDGRFVDRESGASLGDLAALEPGWQRERVPGAAIAYRHADGSRASWVRNCRGVEASPKALGRALWIALPDGEIEDGGAIEVAGRPGWRHVGRALAGATEQRIATIARVTKPCEDYWLLVVPQAELRHGESFEAWAQSLRDEGSGR